MGNYETKQERQIGQVASEQKQLAEAIQDVETELQELAIALQPVLRSKEPSPANETEGPDSGPGCPLGDELAGSRRIVRGLARTICCLKDRLEV